MSRLNDVKNAIKEIVKGLLQHAPLNHPIIVGSLSAFGAIHNMNYEQHQSMKGVIPNMLQSPDFDVVLQNEAGKQPEQEFYDEYGFYSQFRAETGFYADKVSLSMLALPFGWENRLIKVNGFDELYCADPNDIAVSKLTRANQNDIQWISNGIQMGIMDAEIINQRFDLIDIVKYPEESFSVSVLRERLFNILHNVGHPPLLCEFDWQNPNGEQYETNDWDIEVHALGCQKQSIIIVIIKPM